jgi:D-ribulokinase
VLVLGIDVGTQGVRAICCDGGGHIAAQAHEKFGPDVTVPGLAEGLHEQYPHRWWQQVRSVLSSLVGQLDQADISPRDIVSIAVDSTSGTILPIDSHDRPLRPAMMYNDTRAVAESQRCNDGCGPLAQTLGYRFNSSFGLPKALWIATCEPEVWARTRKVIHAADYIVGKLTGQYDVTDNSNCLKTGYNLSSDCWPDFIWDELGLDRSKLPEAVTPGARIGVISSACASETGLAAGTPVVGGVSDGTAGFIACGASAVGDWSSTLGTTLVLRGVSEDLIADPEGRVYCHRHPDGYWLPGGASSVGGECLEKVFPGEDYAALDSHTESLLPTVLSVYPLVRKGERLPFVDPEAQGFVSGSPLSMEELYGGYLEGVAYVEKWCYELMESLGAPTDGTFFTAGGGSKSKLWMTIRASVLNRPLTRPSNTESAVGAAIVAASRELYGSLVEASGAMVKPDLTVEPDSRLVHAYGDGYARFRGECAARGLGEKPDCACPTG